MATPGQEKVDHGVKIDSNLIPTVSGDDDLSGLGVSVYNQEDFEAAVLRQIDTEVQRRNADQAKAFLVKQYNNVQSELRTVQAELKTISKGIAVLLSQPLSHVVLKLRELRASQEVKRKQISSLQAREQTFLRKLSGKEDPLSSIDVVSTLGQTTEAISSERQRLIETGQITPFDTLTSSSLQPSQSTISSIDNSPTIQPSTTTNSRLDAITPDSLTGPSSSNTTTWGVKPQRISPTLQLSTASFDGLFSQSTPSANTAKKATGKSRNGKNKAKPSPSLDSRSSSSVSIASGASTPIPADLPGGSYMVNTSSTVPTQTGNEATPFSREDMEEWMPTIQELENFDSEESAESEYYTDDELGGGPPKRKRRLRALSSDDMDSGDDGTKRKKGRGSGRGKRACTDSADQRKHLDDGDEQLYKMRISEVCRVEPCEEDMVFNGGLRIPAVIWRRLYRYQQTGVKWLWELHCQQAGGIVGDEMGLGKTIEMIAFLTGLQVSNLRSHTTRELGLGPCLVVCPATVMHQWVSEFHSWWAPFRVAVLHETGTFSGDRHILVERIVKECGVLVTTYAGIRIYQDLLLKHKWDYLVLDEGHKIRNPDAEITLACKQFPTPHRIILSGSPMQNNLRELWSLFDFVFPGKLGTLPVFLEQFSVPIIMGGYVNATEVQVQTAYRCACVLRDTINPYLLRRMKADVKIQLPDKNEQVLFCHLTDYQHEVYSDYLKGSEVERALSGRKQVFSALTTLRKLCNHPDLVTNDYSEQVTLSGGNKKKKKASQIADTPKANIKKLLPAPSKSGEDVYGYYKRSGKMIVIHSLLRLWQGQGHRVLLFSQSKLMLDILESFVCTEGYTHVRMDGGTPVAARQPLVNRFNQDSSIFVFLLTTRVGGLGVNLTGANRVILYDPDWNPSTDTQARERAWRIGQTRHVTVYRLLTSGTIEEKIYHRQIFKQFLTNRVLKDPRQRRFFKTNDIYDLFTLDSTAKDGTTETSALFAGTGSEVTPKKSRKRSERKSSKKVKKRKTSVSRKRSSCSAKDLTTSPAILQTASGVSTGEVMDISGSGLDGGSVAVDEPHVLTAPDDDVVVVKRKKRKHKSRRGVVDGCEVEGLEHTCVYQPGSGDEGSNQKQDDFILKKLFKKTGVHSAMQHDVIMNSADPDYMLVEAEASKVAKSAVKAMKASRRQCHNSIRWGRPTWTGSSGVAGAPGLSMSTHVCLWLAQVRGWFWSRGYSS
ncbi:DNA excision repair protein ERCC-6-like isoform X2 [Halichondria panicea]|uniref:DNA excision repair protein ERCC-6-like isoform X2 n=1 Tax=Halichondria panicea TaxID=6063 RepID=UPI00312BBC9C